MNRPWLIWFVLGACAAVILGMFSWMTLHALDSERERLEMESQAQIGERMRLSLARMDTVGTELLVVENQRPPFHYESFYFPEDVMTNTLQTVAKGVVLQASPLLLEERDLVKMHFEVDSRGGFRSPQCPTGSQRERAVQAGVSEASIEVAAKQLDKIREIFPKHAPLAAMMCDAAVVSNWGDAAPQKEALDAANSWMLKNAADNSSQKATQQLAYQNNLNTREKQGRAGVIKKAVGKATERSSPKTQQITKDQGAEPSEQIVSVAPLLPIWVGEELLLIREVKMTRSTRHQGVWLNRDLVEAEFLEQIPDDLVCAELRAVKSGTEQMEDPMVLASLPWKLVQGANAGVSLEGMTPLRSTLIAGWIAAILALAALYLLVRGVLKLSERRAAFVSSVTHELRTPLTTFRLYSEMLSEGMVTDPEKQRDYLRTMLGESERLNHLVENVLAYSRIERGNARSKFQEIAVPTMIEEMRPILQRRVDQEDAALSIEVAPEVGVIETDVTAVGQILFNLVDNACKYGLPEKGGGAVTLWVGRRGKTLEFVVSDEGRGIAPGERKRLFRAFHKSALDAAHDKPGVGLGLALCRRLAKALGGNLILEEGGTRGASFKLLLPS